PSALLFPYTTLFRSRPAMGKSVLAGDFARYTAIRNDIPTVFFSLEMGRKELEKRFLSAQATYPLHWMKAKGPIDDGKVMDLVEADRKSTRLNSSHDQ